MPLEVRVHPVVPSPWRAEADHAHAPIPSVDPEDRLATLGVDHPHEVAAVAVHLVVGESLEREPFGKREVLVQCESKDAEAEVARPAGLALRLRAGVIVGARAVEADLEDALVAGEGVETDLAVGPMCGARGLGELAPHLIAVGGGRFLE